LTIKENYYVTQQTEYSPPRTDTDASSVPESVVSEAAEVGKSAAKHTGEVTEVVGDQAKQVVSETRAQARHLFAQGVDQLREQASEGQHKVAGGLRSLADQLGRMSDRTDGSGMAADLIQHVSERTSDAASWLESRELGDLVNEARRFARQRPGMFLAGAAVAGAMVGRLTRNVASPKSTESDADQQHDGISANGQPGLSAHQVTPTAPPHTAAVTPAVGEPRQEQVAPAGQYGTNPVLP
jgi:hypothetical protein